jgi:hypothetical protein
LQTLGLFFFAGGFAAVRSMGAGPGTLGRLLRPVGVLAAFWAVTLAAGAVVGTPAGTLRTIAVLVISPLWFLLPYLALRAAGGPLVRVTERAGPWAVALPALAVVAGSDAGLVPSWSAVPAAWSIPWVLGIALARGRLRAGLPLLVAGAGTMAVLIGLAGYPASAVGVPGDGRSNLSPPSLLAVALAAAQIGLFLLVRRHLSGAGVLHRLVAGLNRAALPVYLGHQSVLIAVTAIVTATAGTAAPGLLTAPDGPGWIMLRIAWLPFLALTLAATIALGWRTTRRAPRGLNSA